MKLSAAVLTFFFSINAFAISNQRLIAKCWEVGAEKIRTEAVSRSCEVDLEEMEVALVENHFWNDSKYVYYKVASFCDGEDSVIAMVEYDDGQCF